MLKIFSSLYHIIVILQVENGTVLFSIFSVINKRQATYKLINLKHKGGCYIYVAHIIYKGSRTKDGDKP